MDILELLRCELHPDAETERNIDSHSVLLPRPAPRRLRHPAPTLAARAASRTQPATARCSSSGRQGVQAFGHCGGRGHQESRVAGMLHCAMACMQGNRLVTISGVGRRVYGAERRVRSVGQQPTATGRADGESSGGRLPTVAAQQQQRCTPAWAAGVPTSIAMQTMQVVAAHGARVPQPPTPAALPACEAGGHHRGAESPPHARHRLCTRPTLLAFVAPTRSARAHLLGTAVCCAPGQPSPRMEPAAAAAAIGAAPARVFLQPWRRRRHSLPAARTLAAADRYTPQPRLHSRQRRALLRQCAACSQTRPMDGLHSSLQGRGGAASRRLCKQPRAGPHSSQGSFAGQAAPPATQRWV